MPRRIALYIVAGTLAVHPAMAAEVVVVRSTAAELPTGKVLDGDAPLTLAADTRVTLVTEAGKSVTLEGPFSGPPAPGGGSGGKDKVSQALSGLIARGDVETRKLGTFRNVPIANAVDAPPAGAAVGGINLLEGGNQCVIIDNPPSLRVDGVASGTFLSIASGKKKPVVVPLDPAGTPWPQGLKIVDGASYDMELSQPVNGVQKVSVRLHLIPAGLPSDAHQAASLADKMCDRQAREVLSSLAQ